jgi:hypothetical protein
MFDRFLFARASSQPDQMPRIASDDKAAVCQQGENFFAIDHGCFHHRIGSQTSKHPSTCMHRLGKTGKDVGSI